MTKSYIDVSFAQDGLADSTDERSNCGVGAVADFKNGASHRVVADSLGLLGNLEHRGITGAEENTGDGAGILLQRPDEFFEAALESELPDLYVAGSAFMPTDGEVRERVSVIVEDSLADHGLSVFDWRDVLTDNADLGATVFESELDVWQLFVEPADGMTVDEFDRVLHPARRAAEKAVDDLAIEGAGWFYVCSLDCKTIVYKGLSTAEQLPNYYPDLSGERTVAELALVYARSFTNTPGAWHPAHPYRQVIHDSEVNAIRGNVNWMCARETDLQYEAFGDDIEMLMPITKADQSNTASVDNVIELLLKSGRELPCVLRMPIPEAYHNDDTMDQARRDWYNSHASSVEPRDGPTFVVVADGDCVVAILDRNGLRPCRYEVTTDGRLVVASEIGALDTDPAELEPRGRLQPGGIFMADPEEGHIIPDAEVFDSLTDEKYGGWVDQQQCYLDDIVGDTDPTSRGQVESLRTTQAAFGYMHDQLNYIIEPMVRDGKDPVGPMGNDTPLSMLSDLNRLLFTCLKQLFVQVLDPPIDYVREKLVTSPESRLDRQRNLLDESPEHVRQLVPDPPVLTDAGIAAIKDLDDDIQSEVVDITYGKGGDVHEAIEAVRDEAKAIIKDGVDIVALFDRATGPDHVAISSPLAMGAVHYSLIRNGLRNHAGLVVESGNPREVHHLATLVGYGMSAVNPYLAYQVIEDIVTGPDGADEGEAIDAYVHAPEDGLLKTMVKMGISTVESYHGVQIFEAVGLGSDFVTKCFEGTEIHIEDIGLDTTEEDPLTHHAAVLGTDPKLERQGEYENRPAGIHHGWNPQTVGTFQQSVRASDCEKYREFAELVNGQSKQLKAFRGLLEFDSDRELMDTDEVRPVGDTVKRFSAATVSFGSLSPKAHEDNSIAMNCVGGKSNSGEGGEPPERFGIKKECNVKQVAPGRLGVTSHYLLSADEIQIKMAQGSELGEDGHLPGKKVNEMTAHVRYATLGVDLIPSPPLHDIYSIEGLKQLIFNLRSANPNADINVKPVSEAGIDTIVAGVSRTKADVVHIPGYDGGTGASPKTSIKNAGLLWEPGLVEANQMLCATGLRSRIHVSVDGGMKTGHDVAVAVLLGGEEYVFGTASPVISGCVMVRQCRENTCPVGIAMQDENLHYHSPGEPNYITNYMTLITQELREIMADLGFTSPDKIIGRLSLLRQVETDHEKAKHLDLSSVLAEPEMGARRKTEAQVHIGIETHADHKLTDKAADAIENREPVVIRRDLSNVDHAVGAMPSNRTSNAHDGEGPPDDTIRCKFDGIAGQTFGGFLARGVTMRLTGAVNDYVGRGLSDGRVIVDTLAEANYEAAENILIGNVAFYGATQGECYVNGLVGERFGVRNFGVKAAAKGVGDYGCEYMTGDVVVVLGETGHNFAAGMSGGAAYVYDPDSEFAARANTEIVTLEDHLDDKDEAMLTRLVENHRMHTDSDRAAELLDDWRSVLGDFVKVMPDAYAEVIAEDGREDVRNELLVKAGAIADAGADRVGAATTSDD